MKGPLLHSRFTYEIAPVFTLMEDIVLTKMREFIGWEDGDGIFSPGGAISNLYAVACARHKYLPEVKNSGLRTQPQLVMYTSEQVTELILNFAMKVEHWIKQWI